ncbi:MAG TPA: lipid II flippase MurJ [Candidatus Paceibacterota bacterium]|nr:lipid II flippase MurJ [Candidatus Paceibacterota bacterium]
MVKGLLRLLNREFDGLHEAALLLAGSMLLSQFLALIRDRLLAATFGASSSLDIYYSAFRLPDLLYTTIASFVSVAILIPFLIERLEKGEEESARNFLSAVFSLFTIVMVIVSVVTYLVIPYLAPWLTPGFQTDAQIELVGLARILLLSPFLLGLSNLLGSVTQAYRKFLVFSLSPVLYNLGIIFGIIFFVPLFGLRGLAWGVIVGALLHLAIQLPTLIKIGFWPSWSITQIKTNWNLIKKMILISWPRTLTLSSNQLVIIVLIAIASYLGKGTIAIFNFSLNLQSVPLSIVGVSYSVAAFPTLSKYFARGHLDKFINQIMAASRHIVFWSIPASVIFIVLRAQIVRVILGSGNFDWTATRLTAACLALFSLSVLTQSLVLLFVRGYYAASQTAKPLVANIFSSSLIIILSLIFSWLFENNETWRLLWENLLRVRDLPGAVVLMLPLAYSVGSIINCFLLGFFFVWDFRFKVWPIVFSAGEELASAVLGGVTTYLLLNYLSHYFNLQTLAGIFAQGLVAGFGGLLINVLALWIMGCQELLEISRAIRHKFWRGQALIPEQVEL